MKIPFIKKGEKKRVKEDWVDVRENILTRLLAPASLEHRPGHIKISNRYHRVLVMEGYPSNVRPGWLEKLIALRANFDLSIQIHPGNPEKVIKSLNKELMKQRSDLNVLERDGKAIPTSLNIAYKDTQGLLEAIQRGKTKLFQVGMYVGARAKSERELDIVTDMLQSTLNSVMLISKISKFKMVEGLRSIYPIADDDLNVTRDLTSDVLAASFPFATQPFHLETGGIILGVSKDTDVPIIINPFEYENSSGLILGKSGGGKSFLVKLLIMRCTLTDVGVVIIDPQGEYKRLVEAHGGRVIELHKDSESMINPLDLMNYSYTEKILSLFDLFGILLGGLTEYQRAVLDEVFNEVYLARGITEDKKTWGRVPPTLADVYENLSKKHELWQKQKGDRRATSAISILNRLRPFATGSFKYFNKPTQMSLDRQVVCFDISKTANIVRPIVMYMVMHYITSEMLKSRKRRFLVIDEAWLLLQHTEQASSIKNITKTGRKFNLGLIMITQDVGDLLTTDAGKAVLANTAWKLLMRMDESVIGEIGQTFNLNTQESGFLLEAIQGEGLLFAFNTRLRVKVPATEEEYGLITTKPEEVEEIEQKEAAVKREEEPIKVLDLDQGVYRKNQLSQDQIDALHKGGYKSCNSMELVGKGRVTFLVKPLGSEGPKHACNVGLLEEYVRKYTEDVQVNPASGADIEFKTPDGRKIAIEYETGKNIEKSRDRIQQKVELLEKNYDEWFFVVPWSHRDKYKKFGQVCNRADAVKRIDAYFQ